MAAQFCVSEAQQCLRTKFIGRRLFYKDVTGTTMDDAEKGARVDGHPHGTAFIAGIQTNARGSKGRQWNAKDSGNLYVSFIIHRENDKGVTYPDKSKENDIDVAGALAVIQVLQHMKVKGVAVKWLNDLVVNGHKLLGTLAEYNGPITVNNEEKILYILGIGLNVNSDVRRDEILHPIATSILCETGSVESREKLFSEIANQLEGYLELERDALHEIYEYNMKFVIGQEMKVYYSDSERHPNVCKYMGVQDDWSVKLSDAEGHCATWSCEYVSIRRHTKFSVYVYNGSRCREWSSRLLMSTLSALVDTFAYEVKYVSDEQLSKGIPLDCILLAVGELKENFSWPEFTEPLRAYVKQRHAFLGIGTGCHVFFQKQYVPTTGAENKIKLHTSQIVDELFYPHDPYTDVDRETDDEDDDGEVKYDEMIIPSINQDNVVGNLERDVKACAGYINVMSYRVKDDCEADSGSSNDKTEKSSVTRLRGLSEQLHLTGMVAKDDEPDSTPVVTENVSKCTNDMSEISDESKVYHQVKGDSDTYADGFDGTPQSETFLDEKHEALTGDEMQQGNKYRNGVETVDDDGTAVCWKDPKSDGKADLVCFDYESGFVCLCSPNIEVTYADVEELSEVSSVDIERLRSGVFKRDNLLRMIITHLGL